jgi:hypothetical protein
MLTHHHPDRPEGKRQSAIRQHASIADQASSRCGRSLSLRLPRNLAIAFAIAPDFE